MKNLRWFRRLVSVVFVTTTIFAVLPFTGLNQSGYGVGGIFCTMHGMTIEKMMVIQIATALGRPLNDNTGGELEIH